MAAFPQSPLRILLSFALIATSASAFAATPQSEGYRRLAGPEISRSFVGKTFSDGVHFSFVYRANGTVEGRSMAKKVTNKWAIRNGALCVTDSSGEVCYIVWKKGRSVRLLFGSSDLSIDGDLK